MIAPLNTEWNRKTGILPDKGKVDLIGIKHGIAYFTWTDLNGGVMFLECDEGVLKKHFSFSGKNIVDSEKELQDRLAVLQQKKTKFLRYPFEVV